MHASKINVQINNQTDVAVKIRCDRHYHLILFFYQPTHAMLLHMAEVLVKQINLIMYVTVTMAVCSLTPLASVSKLMMVNLSLITSACSAC